MTNTVLFNLQAASMAAAVNSGQGGITAEDIPDGGMSFSEILASHTLQTGTAVNPTVNPAADPAAETEVSEDGAADAGVILVPDNSMFAEAIQRIQNSDDTVRKALNMLLKTVLNAMRGTSDGEERKTDMFMILADGSAGFSDEDDPIDSDLLLGAEIMNRLGLMLETAAAEEDSEPDVLIEELEKIVSQILGDEDEDSDETAAADALAVMLNIPPEEIEILAETDSETKTEAIENAVEVLKAPMEAIRREAPEKVPEAEKLYSEFTAEIAAETEEIPEAPVRSGFSALKINNASEQVGNIGRRISSEPAAEETDAPERNLRVENVTADESKADTDAGYESREPENKPVAEIAAAGVQAEPETETVFVRGEIGTDNVEPKLDAETEFSVEEQVRDVVTDEISEFGDRDGTKELVLILRPRELGQIAVKLVKETNTVSVIMSAQYEEVGKLMTQRAAYLSESLSGGNYEVKDVQIVEPGNAAEQMGLNFTDHGFSFARNSGNPNGSDSGHRGGNDSYGEIDGIDEISADQGEIRFREAKLWTTA